MICLGRQVTMAKNSALITLELSPSVSRYPAVRALTPSSIQPPFARYSHGIAVPAGCRLVLASGQLGIGPDGTVPADCEAQADRCFANITAILAEGGMTLADVVRVNAWVSGREHLAGYMKSRDKQFPGTPPASTLMIVSGFARPEFVVEIEVVAAA
jgi:2-iminobutanoate/2-iminopropanoate deaminase